MEWLAKRLRHRSSTGRLRNRLHARLRLVCRLLACVCVLLVCVSAGGCGVLSLDDDIASLLRFGEETSKDPVVVDRLTPHAGDVLPRQIGDAQIRWAQDHHFEGLGVSAKPGGSVSDAFERRTPSVQEVQQHLLQRPTSQCRLLVEWSKDDGDDQQLWTEEGTATCVKKRELSWLESSLWASYEKQAKEGISWLTTSRNTLVASESGQAVLKDHASPAYATLLAPVQRYLPAVKGVLAVVAMVSLVVVGARITWAVREGLDERLLGKVGWIFLGVMLVSSAVSITLALFPQSTEGGAFYKSWNGTNTNSVFYVADWVRAQVDPLLVIASLAGVLLAGAGLMLNQDAGRLVHVGKAFASAVIISICLAGAVNLFQNTFDTWSAQLMKTAAGLTESAWQANVLPAEQFFNLDAGLAFVLTLITWLCGLVNKVFAYFRAGVLPLIVGVAPVYAVLGWTQTGKQGFGKLMGWLVAFLLYKPVAALVMATGSAIWVTGTDGDDSVAITITLQVATIVLLPAMVKLLAPVVASSVSGGSVLPGLLGGLAGAGVMLGGGLLRGAGKLGSTLSKRGAAAPAGATGSAGGVGGLLRNFRGKSGSGGDTGGSPSNSGSSGSGGGAPRGASSPSATPPSSSSPSGADNSSADSGGAPQGASGASAPAPSGSGAVPSGAQHRPPRSSDSLPSSGSLGGKAF